MTHIGHCVNREAGDSVSNKSRVDEIEDGIQSIPQEVPSRSHISSALVFEYSVKNKGDIPAGNGMDISYSSIPPKSFVEPPVCILIQDTIQCVWNDD